jgi:hypothetical protein
LAFIMKTLPNMLFSTLALSALLAFPFCQSAPADEAAETELPAEAADGDHDDHEGGVEVNAAGGYGQIITAEGAMACDALVSSMAASGETPAKVQGSISAVCQVSGCWMKMDCGNGETMRVTFKDYGFFVPKDLSGSSVIIQGVAVKKEVSVDVLRHFAEDEGKSQEEIEAITEPAWELEFVADGVLPAP